MKLNRDYILKQYDFPVEQRFEGKLFTTTNVCYLKFSTKHMYTFDDFRASADFSQSFIGFEM